MSIEARNLRTRNLKLQKQEEDKWIDLTLTYPIFDFGQQVTNNEGQRQISYMNVHS